MEGESKSARSYGSKTITESLAFTGVNRIEREDNCVWMILGHSPTHTEGEGGVKVLV